MNKTFFPGIQDGERILYFTTPHASIKYFYYFLIAVGGFVGLVLIQSVIYIVFPNLLVQFFLLILTILGISLAFFWSYKIHNHTELYVTDRRVVKFAPTSPAHSTTRSLFYDQATKLKTYHENPLLDRILGLGSITLHAKKDSDDIDIDHIVYHEDLGNYIDKLMFTFHNAPNEIQHIREFVPKPRGQRY